MNDAPLFFVENQVAAFNDFFNGTDAKVVWNVLERRKFEYNQIAFFAGIDASDLIRPVQGCCCVEG